jgi:hypothetical protein
MRPVVPQWIIGLVFTLIATTGVYQASRDLRAGVIRSKGWTFYRDKNPLAFWLVHVCRVAVIAFAILVVLHATGLIEVDPVALIWSITR